MPNSELVKSVPHHTPLSDGNGFATPTRWRTITREAWEIPEFGDVDADYDDDLVLFRQGWFGQFEVEVAPAEE